MQDKLSDYGYNFQVKFISSLLTNRNFIATIYDDIKLEYFTSEPIKHLVDFILRYYLQYKKVPTLEVFKVDFDKVDDEEFRKQLVSTIKKVWKGFEATDLEFVQDEVVNFCRSQEMKAALLSGVDLLKGNKFEEILKNVEKASMVGLDKDLGLNYKEEVERRYSENPRHPIPTPWDYFNDILKGGVADGDLAIGLAPSGAGKTWLLAAIGAHAQKMGKYVAHYTLELNEEYVGIRYDCILTGISIDKIHKHEDTVKERLKKIPGGMYIKEYPQNSVTLIGIEAHFNKLKAIGVAPDMIIIDYADLLSLKGYSGNQKYDQLESLFQDLKGMAGRMEVPIWTVSQTNREGLNDEIIEANRTSGAYGKIFSGDFIFSLARTTSDKEVNTGRFHVIKNRYGPDGLTFPAVIDLSHGSFTLHSEKSEMGMEVQSRSMTEDDFNRQQLRTRLSKFSKK